MTTEVFQVSPEYPKSKILEMIQQEHEEIESIHDIYVVDENNKLVGAYSLFDLLIHKKDVLIKDVMNQTDIKFLLPNTSWKEIATYMSKYNLFNVPIVDKNQELLGLVSVDDILPWLLDER